MYMPVSARLCTRVGPCLYRCVCGHLYLHVGLHRGFQNREHRGSRSPIAGPEALGWAGLGPAGPSSAPWTEALLHTPAAGVLASLAQWVSPSGAAPMALSARPVSAPPCILGVQRSEGSAGWPWGAEAACRAPSEETACPPPPPSTCSRELWLRRGQHSRVGLPPAQGCWRLEEGHYSNSCDWPSCWREARRVPRGTERPAGRARSCWGPGHCSSRHRVSASQDEDRLW